MCVVCTQCTAVPVAHTSGENSRWHISSGAGVLSCCFVHFFSNEVFLVLPDCCDRLVTIMVTVDLNDYCSDSHTEQSHNMAMLEQLKVCATQ